MIREHQLLVYFISVRVCRSEDLIEEDKHCLMVLLFLYVVLIVPLWSLKGDYREKIFF